MLRAQHLLRHLVKQRPLPALSADCCCSARRRYSLHYCRHFVVHYSTIVNSNIHLNVYWPRPRPSSFDKWDSRLIYCRRCPLKMSLIFSIWAMKLLWRASISRSKLNDSVLALCHLTPLPRRTRRYLPRPLHCQGALNDRQRSGCDFDWRGASEMAWVAQSPGSSNRVPVPCYAHNMTLLLLLVVVRNRSAKRAKWRSSLFKINFVENWFVWD